MRKKIDGTPQCITFGRICDNCNGKTTTFPPPHLTEDDPPRRECFDRQPTFDYCQGNENGLKVYTAARKQLVKEFEGRLHVEMEGLGFVWVEDQVQK
jgi:hypothetical protein